MSLSSFHILFAYVRKMDVSQGSSSPSGITLRGRGGGDRTMGTDDAGEQRVTFTWSLLTTRIPFLGKGV